MKKFFLFPGQSHAQPFIKLISMVLTDWNAFYPEGQSNALWVKGSVSSEEKMALSSVIWELCVGG